MMIRPGTAEDVAGAMALIGRVVPAMRAAGNLQWDEVYPNAEVLAEDVSQGQLWVVEEAGVVAAVAAFTTAREDDYDEARWNLEERALMVHRLAVDPAYRGRGLADQLMLQAEEVALGLGIQVVRGDTNTANAAAGRLFERMGYGWAGEISLGFRAGMRFACYEKKLGRSGESAPPE